MNRIDLPHFVWAMESLVAGQRSSTRSPSTPTPSATPWWPSQRMLDLPGKSHRD